MSYFKRRQVDPAAASSWRLATLWSNSNVIQLSSQPQTFLTRTAGHMSVAFPPPPLFPPSTNNL
jgi:hypothetical protein